MNTCIEQRHIKMLWNISIFNAYLYSPKNPEKKYIFEKNTKNITVYSKICSNTTVFYIDNKQKCFSIHKSA